MANCKGHTAAHRPSILSSCLLVKVCNCSNHNQHRLPRSYHDFRSNSLSSSRHNCIFQSALGGVPCYPSLDSRKGSHSFEIVGCFSEVIVLAITSVFILIVNLFQNNTRKALKYLANNGKPLGS